MGGFCLYLTLSLSKTRSSHSVLYEVTKYHTWSGKHVFPQRMAGLFVRCLEVTRPEAQVRIDGAHIKMTNINTLIEHCYMNAFISDLVSKHNAQALPENMPYTPMTSAGIVWTAIYFTEWCKKYPQA